MSGGFVASDIARALRRADELQEAERRRREQDVADKFAQIQLQNATRRSQWDAEDRLVEVAARDRRAARETADDEWTKSRRLRTTQVDDPRNDTAYNTQQVTEAQRIAAAYDQKVQDGELNPNNAHRAYLEYMTASNQMPDSEMMARYQRSWDAARLKEAGEIAGEMPNLWKQYGNQQAVDDRVGYFVNEYMQKFHPTMSPEDSAARRAEITAKWKALADQKSPANQAQAAVDEATLRAEAQRISRGRQIAALEAQYNDPATTGIQRQWIEQQLNDLDAQMQAEEVPVARMSRSTAPIVIDGLTMPADNSQAQAPFTGSAPTMPSVFNRGASTNGIADRFRMMSNRENQEPSPDLPTIVVPETRSSDRIAGPFREGTPVTQRRMFAVPNRSAVTSDNGVKTFTLENGERRYIIGNYMFDEAGNPTPLDDETGSAARAPQLRWDPRSRAYWQWDATSNKWVPAEFGTPPGGGSAGSGSVRRTGGNSAGTASGNNTDTDELSHLSTAQRALVMSWRKDVEDNRSIVTRLQEEMERVRKTPAGSLKQRNERIQELQAKLDTANGRLVSAEKGLQGVYIRFKVNPVTTQSTEPVPQNRTSQTGQFGLRSAYDLGLRN